MTTSLGKSLADVHRSTVGSMNLTIAIIGAVAAAAAAIAATGSWVAARRANQTATAVAAIERDRRHDELTPKFHITCTLVNGHGEIRLGGLVFSGLAAASFPGW